MRVIKDKQIIEDEWQRLEQVDDDQQLPAGRNIFPFSYWLTNRDDLIKQGSRYAVCINGEDNLEEVVRDLDHFEMIALEFPAFVDGRCYSHARLLRDQYGYQGELRAVGDVLRDQLFFMQRCGIDSFHLREDKDMEDALHAFTEFSVKYQSAVDTAEPLYKVR